MNFVVPLKDATDRAHVGGKAAGCAAMMRLGLSVPNGFVVTTDAYDEFLHHAGLDLLRTELSLAFGANLPEDDLERRCRKAQDDVRGSHPPLSIRRALLKSYGALADPVAVRSSATVEDGAASAFAGVFHTSLNVRADGVLPALLECWASAFSYAALTHAMRHNIDPFAIKVAVLVQEMVAADRAGVLFTRDPRGTDSARLVVGMGTGDRLVHGDIHAPSQGLERTRRDPLMRAGLAMESALGHPQDIEWAKQGDRTWFLQARPITTLEANRSTPIRWTREISEERFPQPISPLGWSALEAVLPVNLVTLRKRFGLVARRPNDVARTFNHYVYTNKHFFAIPGSMRVNPLRQARRTHHYALAALNTLALAPFAVGRRYGLKWLALSRFFGAFIFPHAGEIRTAWDRQLSCHIREMDAFNTVDFTSLDADRLWAHKEAMENVSRRFMEPDLAIYAIKMACSWMIERLGGRLEELTAGLAENRTLHASAELEELFTFLRSRPNLLRHLEAERYSDVLAGEAAEAVQHFISHNGHMTTNWDLMEPTWGEEPTRILHLLRHYGSENRRSFRAGQAEQSRRREEARTTMRASLPRWLQSFFDKTLTTLHDFMRIDEEHHFYCSRIFQPMRRWCLEVGRRLTETRIINHVEDVWFLTLPEIHDILRGSSYPRRYLVNMRRATFERAQTTRPPEEYIDQHPVLISPIPSAEGELRGEPASAGFATGVVRVVESPEQAAHFQAGEILVTTSPNPAWTPLYAVAAGLVTATGSTLSHGLVSAREYQLPAVVGIPDITRKLSTGQRIRLDGHHGTVTLD